MTTFNMTNCLPKEFLLAKQRLQDHPEIIRLFEEKHSIRKTTIIHAPIGLSEDGQVFFVLYGGDTTAFHPVGVVYYTTDLKQGVVYIKQKNKGAFLGTKQPDKEIDVIIAQNPFEWLALWQEGYANTWMIPDYDAVPSSISNWGQIIFIRFPEEHKRKFLGMLILSFEMDEYNGENLIDMKPIYVGAGTLSPPQTNPFLHPGGFLSYNMHGSIGSLYLACDRFGTYNVRKGKNQASFYIHPRFGLSIVPDFAMMQINFNGDLLTSHEIYMLIVVYIKSNLSFVTHDQAVVLAIFVMYQWVFPHCPTVVNLQIYSTQYQWISQVYNILVPIVPRGTAYNKGSIPSVTWVEKVEDEHFVSRVPMIFMELDESERRKPKNFGYGLPLILNEGTGCKMSNQKWYPKKSDGLRELLLKWSLNFDPVFPALITKYNAIGPLSMVIGSVFKSYPRYLSLVYNTFVHSELRARTDSQSGKSSGDLSNNTIQPGKNPPRSSKKSKTSAKNMVITLKE